MIKEYLSNKQEELLVPSEEVMYDTGIYDNDVSDDFDYLLPSNMQCAKIICDAPICDILTQFSDYEANEVVNDSERGIYSFTMNMSDVGNSKISEDDIRERILAWLEPMTGMTYDVDNCVSIFADNVTNEYYVIIYYTLQGVYNEFDNLDENGRKHSNNPYRVEPTARKHSGKPTPTRPQQGTATRPTQQTPQTVNVKARVKNNPNEKPEEFVDDSKNQEVLALQISPEITKNKNLMNEIGRVVQRQTLLYAQGKRDILGLKKGICDVLKQKNLRLSTKKGESGDFYVAVAEVANNAQGYVVLENDANGMKRFPWLGEFNAGNGSTFTIELGSVDRGCVTILIHKGQSIY